MWVSCRCAQWSLQPLNIHYQYIHSRLANLGGYWFYLTIVYGDNHIAIKDELWREMRTLKGNHICDEWLISGDFNEVKTLANWEA